MARDWSNQVTRRKPPEGPKPETANIPADMKRKLDHVAEISKNARATWFSLILLLLFSTIAVAGVQDRDYFTYGAGLTLPVINFQVPVTSFFAVTPVLILGLYTYLHLYLLKLWRALGDLPGQLPNGVALDDAVFPWMVADAAILLKPGAQGRAFGWLTRSVSFIFLWAAGPIVLSAFWWRSFPPHNLLLTSWIGLLLCVSILGGSLSFLLRWRRLKNGEGRSATLFYPFLLIASVCASVVMLATVLTAGLSRIVWMIDVPVPAWASEEAEDAYQADEPIYAPGRRSWLYSANLYRAELVERPKTWLPRAEALEEFKARFNKTARSEFSKDQDWRAAIEAFETQRGALLESLRAEDFKGRNFQGANLEEAFLPGLDLAGANLHGAILDSAQLEAVDLTSADLQWARLKGADLQGADLQGADL
ncbi:MAG: pentapeptide repeat-containing protein, partial [Rhodobacteraceae bacterium]|nr:pentapeptide repeat-containing protein [Paracoccaceae bacterium]